LYLSRKIKIMEDFEKILDLNNEFEAGLMEEVLNDKKIPFGIVPSGDSALGGIWELENGWGYIEAPAEYKEEIIRLYEEIADTSKQ
jgi:hypothetical protein